MESYQSWKSRWDDALREHHRLLFDYDKRTLKPDFAEHINCPVCGSPNSILWFEKDWFRHVRCLNCSMIYINPRLNRDATHAFYNSKANAIYNETKFDLVSDSTALDDQLNWANLRLIDKARNGRKGVLLEIGSARGFFLSTAKEAGYDVFGLELNQMNYEFSRSSLGNTIYNIDLLDAHFEDGKFDVIYMRDVIEHITSPLDFLGEVYRVMKPGGILFLDTHNVDGWIYKIAKERHTVFFWV